MLYQEKEDEMSRANSTYWSESLKGRDHLEDQGIDGRIILKYILKKTGWDGVDWLHLVQDRDQWQALVDTVMNLLTSIKDREFLS
jgi:hypothetical protein